MSTTARISFCTDDEDPKLGRSHRVWMAKSGTASAYVWMTDGGYPRTESGTGVLDRLERLVEGVRPNALHALRHGGQLAALFIAAAVNEATNFHWGIDVFPTNPTVGAITSYEYLVICHARTNEKPTIELRSGRVWLDEETFNEVEAEVEQDDIT